MIAVLRRRGARRDLLRHRRGLRPFDNEELVGEALAPFRGQVVSPPSSASSRSAPTAGVDGLDSRPEHIRRGRGRIAPTARHRRDRPLLPAPGRPRRADRGRGRHRQGPDRAGQGPALRTVEAGAATIRRAHAVQAVTAFQSEYSLWTREPEAEVLPTVEELGIGFVPFSPLGKGFLTGAVDQNATFGADIRTVPAVRARGARPIRRWSICCADSPRARAPRRPRSPWPGCSPSSRGSSRSPAPGSSTASTRTWRPPASSSRLTTSRDRRRRSQIEVQGARYPEHLEGMTGR